MFLKVKQWVNNTAKNITINTDQITCYSEFKPVENSTKIYLSNNQLIIILQPVSWFDDILVYKNQDPTPVKEIDDHIIVEGDDNPLKFSTNSETIEEDDQDSNERMATEKQISYMKSIREKKGLNVKFPNHITFKFAKEFLDKYAPKKKPKAVFDWEQLDEDADGEFPGYRD